MTAKHQWKKYKIDYDYTYEKKGSSLDITYFRVLAKKEYSDYEYYTDYDFSRNNKFTLTKPKKADDLNVGDMVYAFYNYQNDGIKHYESASNYGSEVGVFKLKYTGYGSMNVFFEQDCADPYRKYEAVVDTKTPKKGAYIGDVVGQEGAYPQDGQKDGFWYVFDKKLNTPPTKPANIKAPDKVISKLEAEISWSESTDPEGDAISYNLERALDRGAFVEVYKGALTKFKDVIKDKGHRLVVYKVTAIDANGDASESLESGEIPVIDNEIPVIETASTNLGKLTTTFNVGYKIKDADSGQTWKVTERLDGKVLKTFDAKVGTSYNSKLSASDWQRVLNGKHILKIEVVDSEQGKDVKEISFEKAVTKLDFECAKAGIKGIDKMPERAILSMGATIPSGASIKVEITNNALDANPTWQDCTTQVLGGDKIFFSNKTKTATKWAVNIRVTGDKKTATEVLSVSSIGGFYD